MRIASLLPSATEIACALGLESELVGMTHECDYPPRVRSLPALTESLIPHGLSSAAIGRAVSSSQRDRHTVYALDEARLRQLEPDLVLTQSLCEVCAVSRAAVDDAVCTMPRAATVLSLDPTCLHDVFADIERVGAATGRADGARSVVAALRARLEIVRRKAAGAARPRVFAAEWLDPPFCAGHWLPEMIAVAGGDDGLGRMGEESARIEWKAVLAYEPEVIVLMPCGFDGAGARREAAVLPRYEVWAALPAVEAGRVLRRRRERLLRAAGAAPRRRRRDRGAAAPPRDLHGAAAGGHRLQARAGHAGPVRAVSLAVVWRRPAAVD